MTDRPLLEVRAGWQCKHRTVIMREQTIQPGVTIQRWSCMRCGAPFMPVIERIETLSGAKAPS